MAHYRRLLLALVLATLLTAQTATPPRSIDDFFRDLTAEWMRMSPNLAMSARYFTGPEQDEFERQIGPLTEADRIAHIDKAKQGLAMLRTLDRSKLTDEPWTSADVIAWQLDHVVREQPFFEREFPLEQFNGANIRLVSFLTVTHPLQNLKDAQNYVAALGQVATRMDEAIAVSKAQAAAGVLPPHLILAGNDPADAELRRPGSRAESVRHGDGSENVFGQRHHAGAARRASRAGRKDRCRRSISGMEAGDRNAGSAVAQAYGRRRIVAI
jgi:uncharacterized protein (DUF885 family)